MSLEKAIRHGKENRKLFRGAKRVDRQCRNHGSCPHCKSNRLYSSQKRLETAESRMKEEL